MLMIKLVFFTASSNFTAGSNYTVGSNFIAGSNFTAGRRLLLAAIFVHEPNNMGDRAFQFLVHCIIFRCTHDDI